MIRMRVVVLLVLAVWMFNPSHARNQNPTAEPKPILLAAIGPEGGDLLNMLYKVGLHVQSRFDPKDDTFAIRVCSNDPLAIALPLAQGAPFLTTIKLEKLGVPKSRIYYLRQTKCHLATNRYLPTEYWLVPKGAEYPDHVEARSAAKLLGQQFTHADTVERGDRFEIEETESLTPQSYATVLEKVVAMLKAHENAIAVIEVRFYTRSRSAELKKRVAETQSYLSRNGISSSRIHTRRLYWGPHSSSPERYPDIFVVIDNKDSE